VSASLRQTANSQENRPARYLTKVSDKMEKNRLNMPERLQVIQSSRMDDAEAVVQQHMNRIHKKDYVQARNQANSTILLNYSKLIAEEYARFLRDAECFWHWL
jgi:hypothetical protein